MAGHQVVITGSGVAAVKRFEFEGVNIVQVRLKNAITGTCHAYHSFKFVKCAMRYLVHFQLSIQSALQREGYPGSSDR